MRLWSGKQPVKVQEFETQQQKLKRLSGDILTRYRRELDDEVHDPARLEAVYGSGFATAEAIQQAEVVALMCTQLLSVPNSQVNVILPDRQQTIAHVSQGVVVTGGEMERGDSFCQHVIGTGRELAIEDALEHPLVCDTKFARNGEVVSYLGVPIANRHAIIIGVLCVFDAVERDWSSADVALLTQLSLVLTRSIKD